MKKLRTYAALVLATIAAASPAPAQEVPYGLEVREPEVVGFASIAAVARAALTASADDASLDPQARGVLLLATRQHPAAVTFSESACTVSPAPADARQCFLKAIVEARQRAGADQVALVTALEDALARRIEPLDDVSAERFLTWLRNRDLKARRELEYLLAQIAGNDRISVGQAVALAQAWVTFEAAQPGGPAVQALIERERKRRYRMDETILIRTTQGASLAATLVRPRAALARLPTAMLFTIYSDPARNLEIAATAAAYGYAGIVVNARGKLHSTDQIRPYEVEVEDTVEAIDWVSRQPWSDGRVGMYGGSYSGFAAWAATKRLPAALKTIVPYVAAIPGQGLPMENNVFLNANYGWPFYVANNRTLDRGTYNDPQRWSALNHKWYASGRRYREIDQVDGMPNPWLQRWLEHPSYDGYWQAMVPYGQDFARIDIPILSITGYYDDGQISAVHYLKEHYRFRPDARHYLVIGPYDHFGAQQSFKDRNLRGYDIDPVAQFDTTELTFQWFDHVFGGQPPPALVQDRINYQVMGANLWRHAPSIETMSRTHWDLYLGEVVEGGRHTLSSQPPMHAGAIRQTVDFSDRATTGAGYYPLPIVDLEPDLTAGLVFQSEPLERETEVSGTFSGELRVRINKRDFDFMVALYELRPDQSTVALSYYVGRASHARSLTDRLLLVPGEISVLPFDRTRVVSRKMAAGSRLVVVLDVVKNGFHQVNHGTGGDVSDESIADAATPLQVEWQLDSFVRIPVTVGEQVDEDI